MTEVKPSEPLLEDQHAREHLTLVVLAVLSVLTISCGALFRPQINDGFNKLVDYIDAAKRH